jgi:hypothetical protein
VIHCLGYIPLEEAKAAAAEYNKSQDRSTPENQQRKLVVQHLLRHGHPGKGPVPQRHPQGCSTAPFCVFCVHGLAWTCNNLCQQYNQGSKDGQYNAGSIEVKVDAALRRLCPQCYLRHEGKEIKKAPSESSGSFVESFGFEWVSDGGSGGGSSADRSAWP